MNYRNNVALPLLALVLTACPSAQVIEDSEPPEIVAPPAEQEVFAPGTLDVVIDDLDLERGCRVDLDITVTQDGKTATDPDAQFSHTSAGEFTEFELDNSSGVNFLAPLQLVIRVTRIQGDCDPFVNVDQTFTFDGQITIGTGGSISWTGNFVDSANTNDDDDDSDT